MKPTVRIIPSSDGVLILTPDGKPIITPRASVSEAKRYCQLKGFPFVLGAKPDETEDQKAS